MHVCRSATRRVKPPGRNARGFTVIEMMTAIVIMAILVGLAVPSFREASLSSKLSGFANDIVASTQLARSEAIKRNVTVTMCASSGGATCDSPDGWEAGWIVLADEGGTNALIQRRPALPSEFRIFQAGVVASVLFPPTVVADNEVTLTVCRAEPEGSQERVVTITAARNARVTTPTAAIDCPD
jgi:type IV fimbrial biogenesis protein FimT